MFAENVPARARVWALPVVVALSAICALLPVSARAGSTEYKYDSLGRLTEISYGTGVILKYVYDAAGNRSIEVVTGTGELSPEARVALIAILTQLLLDE